MSKQYKQKLTESAIDLDNLKGFFDQESGAVLDADTGVPTPITNGNVGVPLELLTFFDPKAIEILTAPRNATRLFGEVIKGDWSTERRKYRLDEIIGNVAPYSDFSENGVSDVNNEYVANDFYRFQTLVKYGDLEIARTAMAKVDLVAKKQKGASTLISIIANRLYMYGVDGLECYGIMNHPLLPSSLTPTTGVGGTTWNVKTANEIFADVEKLVTDLIDKSNSLIDANSSMKLGISTAIQGYLNTTNSFGLSALDMIKKNYPNLEIVPIPEFNTASGNLVYVVANEVVGQETGECVSNQKLRTFPVIPEVSSYKQKWAAGTGGFSLYLPFAVSRMLIS